MTLLLASCRKVILHTYAHTLLFLTFFCSEQLMAFSFEEEYFIQAEYALIEGDSIQANIIFNYLDKCTSNHKLKKLSLMRLYSINDDIEMSSILLSKNKKDSILLQLMLDKKNWESKKIERFDGLLIPSEVDFEKIINEIRKISYWINYERTEELIFSKKEIAFFHRLISDAELFYTNNTKETQNSILLQEALNELVTFLYSEIINQFFLAEFLTEQNSKNKFYFEYKKYLNLIELNRIKASFYSKQFYSNSFSIWKKQLVQTYDIIFFLQKKVFQNGLLNSKRKKHIRDRFKIQEAAIIFYQQQYNSSKDKKWMQKVLTAMENIKSSLLITKGIYYNSDDLLKDLCRNLIAEIEKKESSPSILLYDNDQLKYIQLQVNISQQYNHFYCIHQFRKEEHTESNLNILEKNCLDSPEKNLAIVNFFDSKNYLFALFINGKKEILKTIPKFNNDSLMQALHYLKNTFSNPAEVLQADKKTLNKFQKTSHIIYQSILQPLFEKEIPPNFIIIPDGILNYIPFEALVSDNSFLKNGKVSYLVQDAAIQYYPSLKMLSKQKSASQKIISINRINSFSPWYKSSNELGKNELQLPQLRGAMAEHHSIKEQFSSYHFDQDLMQNDKSRLSKTDKELLHLSMHAASSFGHRKEPGLIISNKEKEVLFLHEIARLPSVPSVVVLSACETGLGEYIKGEGLKSIGHQFLQSGASSTIQSLNKVADASSFQLIDQFYKNLKKETESPRALQNSKIKFLNNADAFYAHPYFWSGFVNYGESFTIEN
ncbi:MAG: CHAT domain-containing protein [Saprospiraceae bacterium]